MNPWLWLLWGVALLVLVFVGTALVAAVVGGLREIKPCPRCGYVRHNKNKDD